jgi:hypothetical protein
MNHVTYPKPSMTAKAIFEDQVAATKTNEQMLDQGRTDTAGPSSAIRRRIAPSQWSSRTMSSAATESGAQTL